MEIIEDVEQQDVISPLERFVAKIFDDDSFYLRIDDPSSSGNVWICIDGGSSFSLNEIIAARDACFKVKRSNGN